MPNESSTLRDAFRAPAAAAWDGEAARRNREVLTQASLAFAKDRAAPQDYRTSILGSRAFRDDCAAAEEVARPPSPLKPCLQSSHFALGTEKTDYKSSHHDGYKPLPLDRAAASDTLKQLNRRSLRLGLDEPDYACTSISAGAPPSAEHYVPPDPKKIVALKQTLNGSSLWLGDPASNLAERSQSLHSSEFAPKAGEAARQTVSTAMLAESHLFFGRDQRGGVFSVSAAGARHFAPLPSDEKHSGKKVRDTFVPQRASEATKPDHAKVSIHLGGGRNYDELRQPAHPRAPPLPPRRQEAQAAALRAAAAAAAPAPQHKELMAHALHIGSDPASYSTTHAEAFFDKTPQLEPAASAAEVLRVQRSSLVLRDASLAATLETTKQSEFKGHRGVPVAPSAKLNLARSSIVLGSSREEWRSHAREPAPAADATRSAVPSESGREVNAKSSLRLGRECNDYATTMNAMFRDRGVEAAPDAAKHAAQHAALQRTNICLGFDARSYETAAKTDFVDRSAMPRSPTFG